MLSRIYSGFALSLGIYPVFIYVKNNLEQLMSTKSNKQTLLGKVESIHESAIATSNSTFWGNIEHIFFMILRRAHLHFL